MRTENPRLKEPPEVAEEHAGRVHLDIGHVRVLEHLP